MLELKNIYKSYQPKNGKKNKVLKNISVQFNHTGMIFILGKSGSGKSTLLNIMGGLDQPDSGDVILNGNPISTLNNHGFDSYRNHYIGFIFQEFNVIDEYSVIDNILLPLKLQQRKIDQTKIEKLLNALGLQQFKNRRINKLSGGQKQRVAIARALIKNPKIILADEPTGNIDNENGIQVMNLLKEISKNTLVIVVSHDITFAKTYGDRIIEIDDGQIVQDNNIFHTDIMKEKYIVSKSKIPLKDALKLGISSLQKKKLKLFFTIILITFSTIFLSIACLIYMYHVNDNHYRIIQKYNLNQLEIKKYSYNKEEDFSRQKTFQFLKKNDVKAISNKLKEKGTIIYSLKEQVLFQDFFKFNIKTPDLFSGLTETYDMYTYFPTKIEIIEWDQSNPTVKENIIGHIPNNTDEIMISNYIADIIIKYGIYEYGSNQVYLPNSYEELTNCNKSFHFGKENNMRITGIIEYDLSPYQSLKNQYQKSKKVTKSTLNLSKEFNKKISNIYNKVYTKIGFINALKTPDEKELSNENYYLIKTKSNKTIEPIHVISNEVEYFNGTTWKTTNQLHSNEMLIDISNLVDDYDAYQENLTKYIQKYPNRNSLELEKEFIENNINIKSYIGNTVNLEIHENKNFKFQIEESKPTKEYKNIKIIGVSGLLYSKHHGTLLSKNILENYIDDYIKIDSVMVNSNNAKDYLKRFPYNGKYAIYTPFSTEIEAFYNQLLQFQPFIHIFGICFLLFSILLIYHFISQSIIDRKKIIGILKSLGMHNIDICKIFLFEGIILSIISTILSSISLYMIFQLLNHTMMSGFDITILPFYLNINLVILLFIYTITVIVLACIIPLSKIMKMKPIDAIQKR